MRFFLGLLLSLSLCFSTLVYTVNAHSENNIFMNTTSDADAETASDITTEHTAAPVLTLTASSALLMDAATGTVLFEQNAAKERPIASVTKIMTLLLIFRHCIIRPFNSKTSFRFLHTLPVWAALRFTSKKGKHRQ